jgi:hypothetical protein
VLAEIEGEEFDLLVLNDLLRSVDHESIYLTEPLASRLVSLGIVESPGDAIRPAVPGPRFLEARRAVAEAIRDADIDIPDADDPAVAPL